MRRSRPLIVAASLLLASNLYALSATKTAKILTTEQCFNDWRYCDYWVAENCPDWGYCTDSSLTCPWPNYLAVCFN